MTVTNLMHHIPFLKSSDIQYYLHNTGWKSIAISKPQVALFQKETGTELFEATLPLSRDFADYNARIYDVILEIAAAEQRDPMQIIADLSLPNQV
jgi:hypothetical protein